MPRYEFRCRECEQTFELTRPMATAGDPARCPHGHADTVKLLSTIAMVGGGSPAPAPAGGGGCCGGGCGCG